MFEIHKHPKYNRMNFRDFEVCVFDFETTGVEHDSRIVQATFVRTRLGDDNEGFIVKEVDRLVNPGIPIPLGASEVHGIYNEDVANKPMWTTTVKEDWSFGELFYYHMNTSDILCGYNIHNFDIPVLYNELQRCELHGDKPLEIKPYLDLIYWYREWNSKMSDAKQSDAARRLGCGANAEWGAEGARYHNALTDVRVCANLLWKMSQSIISLTTMDEVFEEQQKLIERQNAYLEKRYGKRK